METKTAHFMRAMILSVGLSVAALTVSLSNRASGASQATLNTAKITGKTTLQVQKDTTANAKSTQAATDVLHGIANLQKTVNDVVKERCAIDKLFCDLTKKKPVVLEPYCLYPHGMKVLALDVLKVEITQPTFIKQIGDIISERIRNVNASAFVAGECGPGAVNDRNRKMHVIPVHPGDIIKEEVVIDTLR